MAQENKNKKGGALKKFLVLSAMLLAFAGSMWLIFAPSKKNKEAQQQQAGLNTDVPDPRNAGIIGDKKSAYEQEQMRRKEEEKMRSLQEYSFDLSTMDESQYQKQVGMAPVPVEFQEVRNNSASSAEAYRKWQGNSIEASKAAYQDINRTLGNFYEEPEEDPEKEELRKEIEELKTQVAQQAEVQPDYQEQLALLEKSYELAAKYMPGAQNGQPSAAVVENTEKDSPVEKNGKMKVVPVGQVVVPVVSALWQPMTDTALTAGYPEERNTGFHTAVGAEETAERNTIKACVYSDQTVTDGQSVQLRLLEQMQAGKTLLPRNAVVTGICKIQGERLGIAVNSLEYNGHIIPVELTVYDSDGQEGIFIPGSMEVNAVKEVAANLGQNLGTTVSITNQSAGDQLLSELGKGAIQGASQYISKKMRLVKVHLKAGYNLMLFQKQN